MDDSGTVAAEEPPDFGAGEPAGDDDTITYAQVRSALEVLRRIDSTRTAEGKTVLGLKTKNRVLRMLDILEPIDARSQKLVDAITDDHAVKDPSGSFQYRALQNGGRDLVVDDPIAYRRAVEEVGEMEAEGLPDDFPQLPRSMMDSIIPYMSGQDIRALGPFYLQDQDPDS